MFLNRHDIHSTYLYSYSLQYSALFSIYGHSINQPRCKYSIFPKRHWLQNLGSVGQYSNSLTCLRATYAECQSLLFYTNNQSLFRINAFNQVSKLQTEDVSYLFARETKPSGVGVIKPEGRGHLLDTASTLIIEVGEVSVSSTDPAPSYLAFSIFLQLSLAIPNPFYTKPLDISNGVTW